MNNLRYFFQYLLILPFFIFFKLVGLNSASYISGKLFELIGPFFRSKKIIHSNIAKAFPNEDLKFKKKITSEMWNNYGRVFAEYIFIKNYRNNLFTSHIKLEGHQILDDIKKKNKPVIFISGHFSNFELMAMTIEKLGIKLAAIYRPLNNKYINKLMEKIRINHICKYQIKKGVSGLRELIKLNKEGFSTALMIDQRVSQGIKLDFFNHKAYTTTIPAQLNKKYGYSVVPLFIERYNGVKFKISIHKPIEFSKDSSQEEISAKLNGELEKMILYKPGHWIWSHNRWK